MFKAHRIHGNLNISLQKTACFTGHRPPQIGGYGINPIAQDIHNWIVSIICKSVEMNKHNTFITGMALGTDTIAAEAVLECRDKKKLPIQLICAIPFLNQPNVWPYSRKTKWNIITSAANAVVEVSPDPVNRYDAVKKLDVRNNWMVDHSTLCLAVWTGTPGGTANCIRYARKNYRQVVVYDPTTNMTRIIEPDYTK